MILRVWRLSEGVSWKRIVLRLILLPLARLVYPPCPKGTICRSRDVFEHGPGEWTDGPEKCHSIREICMLCGRRGPWQRVVF